MTSTVHYNPCEIYEMYRFQIYGLCHPKRQIGRALPAKPSFNMTTTEIIKDAF